VRGVLITFEGVEGSGKSTQAEKLAEHLLGLGLAVELSREPGGTPIGEQVREILLDPENRAMDGWTELFLYLASRNQHVMERLLPALRAGKVVVLDRYAESSVAYQGAGREIGAQPVTRLNRLATRTLRPDLTVLVDVPVRVGQERKSGGELDRLESERIEFHERVREGYLKLARRAPKRVRVVDGRRPQDELAAEIREMVRELLVRKGLLKS
jgi:dTMP kinase